MINRRTAATALTAALGATLASAAPAAAGGVLPIGSPAFGTSCANHHTGAHASGTTTHGNGAAGGNLAGLPLGSALNQCGGADTAGDRALVRVVIGHLNAAELSTLETAAIKQFDAVHASDADSPDTLGKLRHLVTVIQATREQKMVLASGDVVFAGPPP